MANFWATYPVTTVAVSGIATVQGEGTPGTPAGGILTVQGDPSGEPLPISGSISATNPSVSPTGASVPADATYIGMEVGGNLTGLSGTSDGLKVDGSAVIQPVSGTVTVEQATAENLNATVTGTVDVGNFPSTQPISGIVTADQGGSWTVDVSNFPATQPISGTVTADQGGSWSVQINAALPAGTNTIGNTIATATLAASWQAEGSLAFGSITGTYQTVFTPASNTRVLFMRNNTNASIDVSMDSGSTLNFVLDPTDKVSIDFVANGIISPTTDIQIRQTTSAPTSGSFRVNACS